jgi:hypothetical protein
MRGWWSRGVIWEGGFIKGDMARNNDASGRKVKTSISFVAWEVTEEDTFSGAWG